MGNQGINERKRSISAYIADHSATVSRTIIESLEMRMKLLAIRKRWGKFTDECCETIYLIFVHTLQKNSVSSTRK